MTRLLILLPLVACATPHPDAFTVVGMQEGHKVSLTWEGGDACASRDDVIERCYPADSAAAAVWSWYEPDAPPVTGAVWFQPALTEEQILAIDLS